MFLLLIISTYVIKQDEPSSVCTRKQNALVLYQWKLYFICFNIWYNQFCYMVVKYGVSAIPLIPKLTHFSIGSFAASWVWNPPHPLPWSMASVDRYRLVYCRTSMCWHIMPVFTTCRTLQWWNKYITSKLSNCGFATWVSRVRDLANMHNVELYNLGDLKTYKARCKSAIVSNFKQNWQAKLHDLNKYPIMRTYALFKFDFECETYLNAQRDRRYRNAISKFRLSSHNLEIERGRHCNPKVPVSERLCFRCNCKEDEQHFLVSCKLYEDLRVDLYDKVSKIITDFYEIGDRENSYVSWIQEIIMYWLGWVNFYIRHRGYEVVIILKSLCDI